jgi:hypothetical protein
MYGLRRLVYAVATGSQTVARVLISSSAFCISSEDITSCIMGGMFHRYTVQCMRRLTAAVTASRDKKNSPADLDSWM